MLHINRGVQTWGRAMGDGRRESGSFRTIFRFSLTVSFLCRHDDREVIGKALRRSNGEIPRFPYFSFPSLSCFDFFAQLLKYLFSLMCI